MHHPFNGKLFLELELYLHPTQLPQIFTPDASSTTVVIEVSVSSNLPCTAVETKQFTLNGIKKPVVSFANTSATICNTQTSYPLNATTVANTTASTTYLWTTTGTGTFANNTTLVTTYNFSAADLNSNSVTLRFSCSIRCFMCID